MIDLYTNFKSTGEWDKHGADHNKVLVTFSMTLKQEHAKIKKSPCNLTSSAIKTPATETGNSAGRLHGNLRMSGRPLCALTPGPSMSSASFTAGKTKRGYRTACICLNLTTAKIGPPVGPNTYLALPAAYMEI